MVSAADVPGLRENRALLSEEEHALAALLLEAGQVACFSGWAPLGTNDAEKHAFFEQVRKLEANYPGGLRQYVDNARRLLQSAARGQNPLDGWSPSVPTSGFNLAVGSPEFLSYEAAGLKELRHCCFVIPAGGLGERLGFSGVKFALPADLVSGTCVLGVYAAYIRAFEVLSAEQGIVQHLPLVIMASEDTYEGIKSLLSDNGHFGLQPSQVTVLMQEKVAALADADGNFAMESPYRVATKPHGHGDIHYLLHSSGTVERWAAEGRRWVLFFQDTNTLYLMTFLCSLGVSATHGLHVNSVAMPRRAKEAVGAIAQLRHRDGRSVVCNVEYNQLEPLLLATGHPEGDVDGPDGYSPYPGNTNELIFSLSDYAAELRRTQGQVPEFINPKYTDDTRTKFKCPTRLECMMQDYPKGLDSTASVGFTRYPLDFGYFPCKNDIQTAARLSAGGSPPHGAASAEAAVYRAYCSMLALSGVDVGEPLEYKWRGGSQQMGPAVALWPDFAPALCELQRKLPTPGAVRITSRSSLVVHGCDVRIDSLELDGALEIRVVPGATLNVLDLVVHNRGLEFVALTDEEQAGGASESLRIRGYRLVEHEKRVISIDEVGVYSLSKDRLEKVE